MFEEFHLLANDFEAGKENFLYYLMAGTILDMCPLTSFVILYIIISKGKQNFTLLKNSHILKMKMG